MKSTGEQQMAASFGLQQTNGIWPFYNDLFRPAARLLPVKPSWSIKFERYALIANFTG